MKRFIATVPADKVLATDNAINLGPNSFDSVAHAVPSRTYVMDKALRYIATGTLRALHTLLKNSWINSLKEDQLYDWPEETKCIFKDFILLIIFQVLLSCIPDVLRVRIPVLLQRRWLT